MIQKIQISLLMLFSLVVIIFGGYNCSTKVTYETQGLPEQKIPLDNFNNRNNISNNINSSHNDNNDDNVHLPEEPGDNYCNRGTYSRLSNKHGASAFVELKSSGIFEDYRLGERANFEVKCLRVFLDMSKVSKQSYYSGEFTLSYEDNNSINISVYKSGSNSENKHNKWVGSSWSASSRGKISKDFYAIFEHKDRAAILNIDEVREDDVADGKTRLLGSGEIWVKMFRSFSGDKSDKCYKKGPYLSLSRVSPPSSNARCWLTRGGPYSCSPLGVSAAGQNITDFDLEDKDYDCYDKLGEFRRLDLREAFNVDDDQRP